MKTRKLYALLECDVKVLKIATTAFSGRPYVELLIEGKVMRVYENDEPVTITLEGKFENAPTVVS